MKKQLLTFIFVITGWAFAKAQIAPENHSIIIKPIFGTHINNDQGHLFQDQITGFDAAYFKEISQNSDKWIGFSGTKSYGIGFIFRDLSKLKGTKDTSANALGQIYSLVAQMDFQLFKVGKAKFNFTPGVGLGYTNKYYYNNTKNRFLGSPVNETIKADLGMELPMGKYTDLLLGLGFLHVSNGGATVPNGGLNTGNIYVGLKLNNPKTLTAERKSTYTTLQRNSIELSAGFGARGVYEQRKKKLYKTGLYIGYNLYLNDFLSIKAGIDAIYYHKTYDSQNATQTFQYYATSLDKWRIGASAGVDANIWKLTVSGQLGKYIHYNRLYKDASWYWWFGPTYNITPRMGIQAKTYMHFFQADYLNYGLIFRL